MKRPTPTFEALWDSVVDVPGWMTKSQARVLWQEVVDLPDGAVVMEIGSHHGRSAVILAGALPTGGRLVTVDPFGSDWRYGQSDTEERFRENLRRTGVADRVETRVATSREVLSTWHEPLSLVYVDGKHDYWSVLHDLGWASHLPQGAHLLLHDTFSSIGVTLGVLRHGLGSKALRYQSRTGTLAVFEVAHPTLLDRMRLLGPLPWWVRNVAVKILLRLRMRRTAGWVFGHHDLADPY